MKTAREQQDWEALADGLGPKLLASLRRQTGMDGLDYAVPPAPLGGGYWASLHTFRLAPAPQGWSGDLVLRVMPTSDEQARREAAVQAAVGATGFPAPSVHLSADRRAGLGFPYVIMARVAGGTLKSGLSALDKAAVLRRLPATLAETLAQLHALDEAPIRAALAAAGGSARSIGLDGVLDDLAERAQPLEAPGYGAGLAWLHAHRPAPARSAVCHGDFHPLNLVFSAGRVSGVLDWSHALIAEPEYDVAYAAQLLAFWPLETLLAPRGILKRVLGGPAARQFTRAYGRRRGLDAARLRWYDALHAFRVLVRLARARSGITLPPLAANHPWELVAPDAARVFRERTGIGIVLPPRSESSA